MMGKRRSIKVLFSLLLLTVIASGFGPEPEPEKQQPPVWFKANTAWVDSVFHSLTLDERIAQMMVVPASSDQTPDKDVYVEKLIADYNVGGVLFFQGSPVRQAQLTNHYQVTAKTPLMISMDAEYGLAMRLDSTIKYPYQMTLGAIHDDSLIYQMGKDIGQQLQRLGVHMNLGPVVDVNNNRDNPVINYRSFGEDRQNVASKGLAYMRGLQEVGVMANAKHFPGHGDTDADSHKTLPVVHHSRERLDSVEFYPFRQLAAEGLGSMMVAHMYVPAIDSVPYRASTLSPMVVQGEIRNRMGFEGLIFSDALNMREVTAFYPPGEIDVQAVLAGNDVLLFVQDVPQAIQKIKEAVEQGKITESDINNRCRRILMAKAWMGLDDYQPVDFDSLTIELNHNRYQATNHHLMENALTLLKDDRGLLPLQGLDTLNIAVVNLGEAENNAVHFTNSLRRYAPVDVYNASLTPGREVTDSFMRMLEPYNLVIIGLHSENRSPYQNFGITRDAMNFVDSVNQTKKVVLSLFANPYALDHFEAANTTDALLVAYEDGVVANDLAGQLIFGGIAPKGRLPITASNQFPAGSGILRHETIRYQYTVPEYLGISTEDLQKIDQIVAEGIAEQAFPGCQIFVAHRGKVIYQKSFGHHTYANDHPVLDDDVYDLASITKIAASTVSLMRLTDQGRFDVDSTLHTYLGDVVDSTQFKNLTPKEMLTHQAGLVAWIPFYVKTLHQGKPRYDLYSLVQNEVYDTRVAENLYIRGTYNDTVMHRILHTKLGRKKYKYSDLGYYFMKEIIQRQGGLGLEQFVEQEFYRPLGLSNLGYHPRSWTTLNKIVPTEDDKAFRHQLIHGDVHDPGAAMLGGVGGHAGLFGSANDLGVLMQMLVNNGSYGGQQFISDSTVQLFTSSPYLYNNNRRGIGFDKPVRNGQGGPSCNCVSYRSFGHSGFTGTLAWGDPDRDVVYVFLSNRVYPDATNRKLITNGHRTRIQQVIYDAINNADQRSD